METVFNFLFYLPYIPDVFVTSGNAWGIHTGCLCVLPPFFTFLALLLFALIAVLALKNANTLSRNFLFALLIGIVFVGSSVFIEWVALLTLVLEGENLLWSTRVKVVTGIFQLLGLGFLLWAVIFGVRQRNLEHALQQKQ